MMVCASYRMCFFFFQAEDGIRDYKVTGVQTCALPIYSKYVHDNINRAAGWRSKGWRNFDGKPIDHENLWKRFLSLRSRRMPVAVTFHWKIGRASCRGRV